MSQSLMHQLGNMTWKPPITVFNFFSYNYNRIIKQIQMKQGLVILMTYSTSELSKNIFFV